MSKYLFNISSEPEENDHSITILACLDTNSRFFLKILIFEINKNLLHTLKLSLIYSEVSDKSKSKLHFHDQKGYKFL